MARELVLVPKGKYEHLLKLAGQNEQSGGQIQNQTDISPPDPDIQTKNDTSNVRGRNDNTKENEENEGAVKPALYVNKPLSEMPFNKPKALAPVLKQTGGSKTSLIKRKRKPVTKPKGNTKAKWINYVI